MAKVQATKRVRQVLLLTSLLMGLASLLILGLEPQNCPTADLKFAVWLVFGIHAVIFGLLLTQFLGAAKCLRQVQRGLFVFYFLLVFSMFLVQLLLWSGDGCA